jgi:hypothetical protein
MFDSFDAVCKERAGKVLDEARAVPEQIGISVELLHVPMHTQPLRLSKQQSPEAAT